MATKNLLTYTELGNKSGRTIVLLHGWPDRGSVELYKHQIKVLEGKYRLICCNLPGYEPRELKNALNPPLPMFGYSIDQISDMFFNTICKVCPDLEKGDLSSVDSNKKPFVVSHDWGCVVTGQTFKKHPNFAAKAVYLDIGAQTGFESLTMLQSLMVLWYQTTILLLFFLPAFIGNPCHRVFAKILAAPLPQDTHNTMGYMYLRLYVSILTGAKPAVMAGRDKQDPFAEYSKTSVMFAYGTNKPFFFHSNRWIKYVAEESPQGKVLPFEGGHWFFTKSRHLQKVNDALLEFFN